jgi:phosphatidylserine/phosphatidylglycerophosphate/cardiolipin synthase-like enzyme
LRYFKKAKPCFVFLCSIIGFLSISFTPPLEAAATSYFNHRASSQYFEPYKQVERRGDNFEELILREISAAQSSIHIAIHEIRIPSIARALARRHFQGVRVAIVIEDSYNNSLQEIISDYSKKKINAEQFARYRDYLKLADRNQDFDIDEDEALQWDAVAILRQSGIPLKDDRADGSLGSGLMHHKFMVIDEKRTLVTSANWTLSDIHGDLDEPASRGNSNALVIIDSPGLAQAFMQEWEIMFGASSDELIPPPGPRFGVKKPHRTSRFIPLSSQTRVAPLFSPTSRSLPWAQSTNGVIAKFLSSAKKSVLGALFVFSEQALADALLTAHDSTSPLIKILVERKFAFQNYSEVLDLLGLEMLSAECELQAGNNPWWNPIETAGTVRMPKGDLLHHKFAVVDSRYVIFGSHNWSAAANNTNDENLLIIDSPEVARDFELEFTRLTRFAQWGTPDHILDTIERRQSDCF